MLLIPAIDIHNGSCVRLEKGALNSATVYGEDPGAMAKYWIDQGARRIHVVDLDGAFAGHSENVRAVEEIVSVAEHVPVQLGGGIRVESDIRKWLQHGVSQVIVGTLAVEDPQEFRNLTLQLPGKVILALDVRGNKVATRGWEHATSIDVTDMLADCSSLPLFAVVYTDVERDGMQTGVNVDSVRTMLGNTPLSIIASGGVTNLDDIQLLARLRESHSNLIGVISGRALYEKNFDFRDAQSILD